MEFSKGITAIVGPNGSGKSNVADAVRWVLGEQSPKTLRGGKMQDVIFSGTQQRKPFGIAEVTLSIDNSTRVLPIDGFEATVTRRVLRSGDNEYLINKVHSRLKDVTDLFLDTGLGKEGYSIIGQGRIDEILSIQPGDRRHVFEQAAGIGKYKMRKEEAQVKLLKTSENITRLEDIIYEIEQQLERLKSQRDCALMFNAKKQELKIAEINKFLRLYKRCVEKNEQLNITLKSYAEDLDRLISRLSYDEHTLKEKKQCLNVVQKESEALRDDMHEKIRIQARLKGEYDLIAQKLARLFEDNRLLNEEIAKDEKNLLEIQVIVSKSNESLLSNESIISEKKASLTYIEQELRYLLGQSAIDVKRVEQSRKEISILSDELADLKTSSAKHETIYGKLINERIEINNRYLAEVKHQKTLLEDINYVEGQIDEKVINLGVLEADRRLLESDISTQSKALRERENSINNRKQNIESVNSKLDILESMHANLEGYSLGVKNILRAKNQGKLPSLRACGTIADLIDTDKDYRVAIEACLGNSMQSVVTENEQDAKEIIEFLRASDYGRATFLPITSVRSRVLNNEEKNALLLDGALGVASALVVFEEKYRGIIENLLGRTVIVKTIEQAIKMAKKFNYSFRIVTLMADVLNPGGSITGGSSIRKSNTLIGRKHEIDGLRAELQELKASLSQEICTFDVLNKSINEKKTHFKSVIDNLRESEIQQVILKQRLESKILENKKQLIEIEKLNNRQIKLDIDIEENISQIKLLIDKTELLEKEKLKLLDESQRFESEIENITVRKMELEEQIARLKTEISYFEREVSAIKERVRFQTADIKRFEDICEKRKRSIKENLREMADIEAHASLKKLEEQELASIVSLLNMDILRKDEERQSLIECLAALESSIEQSRLEITQNKDLQHKTELKISKLEAEKEHLDLYIWEEYHISYGHALNYFDRSMELNIIESEILSLKQDIEGLGVVNINSIDDYSRLRVRYETLNAQKQDLLVAKRNLDRVIEEITIAMKKEFCSEFEKINENFSIVFSKLFGGGKAQLILEDKSRPLDCGIEIAAQPPGKKLQSISLMSGGEKALTASAILFAILMRKPALFCVLDEIDAVLDESNLYNLGNFLRDFSSKTQFIVITHRKVTMEMCDTLYGVVMEEKGISKLVSVKLEGIAV